MSTLLALVTVRTGMTGRYSGSRPISPRPRSAARAAAKDAAGDAAAGRPARSTPVQGPQAAAADDVTTRLSSAARRPTASMVPFSTGAMVPRRASGGRAGTPADHLDTIQHAACLIQALLRRA
jgi:hypothetical protein